MFDQDGRQAPALPRPSTEDVQAWKAYWKAQGQPWRIEPEIAAERQKYLVERRSIKPDIEKGIYPFKDIKLSRADVEWLLATHESGGMRGPVDWKDKSQYDRVGLDLRGANLRQANLSGLPLTRIRGGLPNSEMGEVGTEEQRSEAAIHLEGANLKNAQLQEAVLMAAQLQEANLWGADLQEAWLGRAHLQGANLHGVFLQEAFVWRAHLQGANLWEAHLQGAFLIGAQLQGANLDQAELDGIYLKNAILSDEKYGAAMLSDIRWGEINLAVVDWGHVPTLGDELVAHQKKDSQGKTKDKPMRVDEYKKAVRANRQLAVVLRNQGLNEEADRFAYRAQVLQRVVWGRQGRLLKYLLSWFLYLIAGYGYRPLRTVIIYLLVIGGFAIGFYEVTHILHAQPYPLAWYEALILSVSSFHGRGFFQPVQSLGDPVAILASIEAVFGLLIEISFIATFTQRFFGK